MTKTIHHPAYVAMIRRLSCTFIHASRARCYPYPTPHPGQTISGSTLRKNTYTLGFQRVGGKTGSG